MKFNLDFPYTLVAINDGGLTIKTEVTIVEYNDYLGRYTYTVNGKQMLFYLKRDLTDILVFEGHNLPILVDFETSFYNATCEFNFVTDNPQALKELILTKCLNLDEQKQAKILTSPTDRSDPLEIIDTPLFPEIRAKYDY